MKNNNAIKKMSMLFLALFLMGSTNLFARDFQIVSSEFNQSWTNHLFADTLEVNESKTKTIHANEPYNWTNVKLIDGQTYRFTVGSPAWNNAGVVTDAEGYSHHGIFAPPRRFPSHNWMALVGSLYRTCLQLD